MLPKTFKREHSSRVFLILVVYIVWPIAAAEVVRMYIELLTWHRFSLHTQLIFFVGSGLLISMTMVLAHSHKILFRPDFRAWWKLLVASWVVIIPMSVCAYPSAARLLRIRAWEKQAAPIPALGGMVSKKYGEWRVDCIDPNVDDTVFQQWIPTLARLRVENLGLRNSQVSDASMSELARVRSLKTLDLTGTTVGDSGLDMLSELTNIEVLVLTNTRVTDRGMVFLSRFPKLQRLLINRTSISNEGLKPLLRLSSLRDLHIGDTDVDEEGKNHFVDSMPKVSVMGPYAQ